MLEVKVGALLLPFPERTDVRVTMVPIVLSGTSGINVLLVLLLETIEVRVVKVPIVLSELLGADAVPVVLLETLSVCVVPAALLEMLEVEEGTGRMLISVGVSSVVVELWEELVHPNGESEQLLIAKLLVGCTDDCSVAGTRTTT